jgi:phosphoglycolate phosphatase
MKTIIWDWNGTLLNDIDLCVSSMNKLLKARDMLPIDTLIYREVFSFPVKDYYQTIGFDFAKEDFEVPAHQYIDLYYEGFDSCSLQKNTEKVLQHFKHGGVRQFVLSAMEHGMLEKTLKAKGIFDFFEGIAGLTDHLAVSKVEQGKILIKKFNIESENTCLIGDTTHDFEVASEIGVKCILIADGHQTEERLKKTGVPVLLNIGQLLKSDFSF